MAAESPSSMARDVYAEADLYVAAFDWPLDAEVDWLLGECGEVRAVLEPFCGNARYGPVFTARGVEYWGLDRSSAMLQRAPAAPGMRLQRGDASDFSIVDGPPRGFDLAWCPINSIRHLLTDREIQGHLRCVRRHMRAGARYVVELDLFAPQRPAAGTPDRGIWSMDRGDGSVVHASWLRESVDAARMMCSERATIQLTRHGRVVRQLSHVYTMRLWRVDEVMRFASISGFEVERVHRSEASAGWPRMELSADLDSTDWNYQFFLRCI